MWSAVTPTPDGPAPSSRSKHSATLLGSNVYLLGGRNGNLPLKDLWRYSLAESRWEQLQPSGDRPPCLQEHSAVAYKENIYVFGGEVGFSAGTETPLWVYQIKGNCWRKVRAQKGVAVPRGRRGHTALVHQGAMLMYGGYQDLRGSSNELWGFHFDTESWHLLSSSSSGITCGRPSGTGGSHGDLPPARHKHSAILHDDAMWVYGGMTDLQERADFWRWDTVAKLWSCIKAKPGPGALHSHAACKLPSSMLMFGGERDGHPTNELWRFHFGTETWERLQIQGPRPQPRAESVALAVSELLLQDSFFFQNQFGDTALVTSSGISSASSYGVRSHRSRGGGSVDRCTNLNPRHSSYHPNNRVSPCERKYVFRPTCGNYVDGSSTNGNSISQEQDYGARRCYSGQQSSVGASTPSGQAQAANSFFREISKLSQINLSRLTHHKCSYSVLSSSSYDDSTESLLHHQCSGSEGGDQGTPSKSTMVKSQSANIISRRRQQELSSVTSPGPTDEFQESESAVVAPIKHHSGCSKGLPSVRRKVSAMPAGDRKCRPMPRDPISVPNFGAISSLPTPVLTPIEVTQLVFVDTDDENETEDVFASQGSPHFSEGHIIHVQPLPSSNVNLRDFAVLHQQFQPHLEDNSQRQSSSHGSHLLATRDTTVSAPLYQNVGKTSGIPKSASVRFREGQFVTELEEMSDETVSTSDYASIETVNRIASASSYIMCNKASPVDNQFLPYQQNAEHGMGKFGGKSNGKAKTPNRDGPFGFCNPNYLGPDIQTILASAGQRKSWHVTTPTSNDNDSSDPPNKHHFQTYARLLNSPPDSVLEDASGRSISRQFYQEELMELQSLDYSCSQSPSQATTPGGQTPNVSICMERAPPQFLALSSPYSTNSMGVEKRKKSRASSASRAEKQMFGHGQEHENVEDISCFGTEPSVPLYMFVLGGKEQGQVTVFKRPVSVWKLQLAPNIF
ncbi:uncharacterized protein LOC110839536 isoform X2 [Zootermopsis nevadensis]|nr:uncharacterized protein LOC110839536 isoform X2 [Zootermopsis nevadensis]XP_021939509.1 uncharacterized protein LOC110839536 isoform X2 [Zootermopsis nevadensis]XP_021939510.1 uncharacterized protein LOC110839536 isoform X2 [Zootermopsis nevadensis]XP_021939511.1 uncharacterized protein LOC110839536 isoform X2 [Zootermopsis nevadensis]